MFNSTTESLEFLDLATQGATGHPALTWVNERFFLLTLRKGGRITLSVATFDGIVALVYNAATDASPQFSFSLAAQEK